MPEEAAPTRDGLKWADGDREDDGAGGASGGNMQEVRSAVVPFLVGVAFSAAVGWLIVHLSSSTAPSSLSSALWSPPIRCSSGVALPSSRLFSASFSALHDYAEATCFNRTTNIVMGRNANPEHPASQGERRPWSVGPDTWQPSQEGVDCNSTLELLNAVKMGQRLTRGMSRKDPQAWSRSTLLDSNNSGNSLPSDFVPASCSIPWLSSAGVCSTLTQYSQVYVVGDSLSRHTVQGLYMLLSQDLMYGALPRLDAHPELYDRCKCDGQYSEHGICRTYDHKLVFHHHDIRQYGVCTSSPPSSFVYAEHSPDLSPLCSNDPRPRFVYLQGGFRVAVNSTRVIREAVTPFMEALVNQQQKCNASVYVLWSGVTVQHRHMDSWLPHQSRENATVFNDYMEDYMWKVWKVRTITFWNLTADAPASDGLHHLSDVNLIKALSILNVMRTIIKDHKPTLGSSD